MKSRRYKLPLIALSLSLALPAFSQSWFTPEVEKRAEDILKNMTVKERLTYIGGIDWTAAPTSARCPARSSTP